MKLMQNIPRGIRNKNPGNIRNGSPWQGLVLSSEQTDTSFCQFTDATWGIRAIAVTLITYQDRYGINTVKGIINRWAPDNENDTASYINAVCRYTSFGATETLDLHRYEALRPIVEAIIRHENGVGPKSTVNSWYDKSVIDVALQKAGVVSQANVVAAVPITKETVAATGTAGLGAAQLADVAPHVMDAMQSSQDHISSGSVVRICFGVATIALAAYIAWSQVRKHQDGVVA